MQYLELCKLLPVLRPRVMPKQLLDHDFRGLLLGKQHLLDAFKAKLAELATLHDAQGCAICGAAGQAQADVSAAGSDDRSDEDIPDDCTGSAVQPAAHKRRRSETPDETGAAAEADGQGTAVPLHFTTMWSLDVEARACKLARCGFCCPACRACMDTGSMLTLAALRTGGAHGQGRCDRASRFWTRVGCVLLLQAAHAGCTLHAHLCCCWPACSTPASQINHQINLGDRWL